jgi:enoyl-CoA hydratase/carnithine racemase
MELSVFDNNDSITGATSDRHTAMESFRYHVHHLQDTFSCLDQARMPVLVAIQGGCIGGAVDMVSACDIRYTTKDAFFCIMEINIGMTADVGTFPRLCKLIPEGWVRELAYTGRRLSAQKAKEIGLVNEVFDTHEDLLAHVLDTAREIASKAPLAVAGSTLYAGGEFRSAGGVTANRVAQWNGSSWTSVNSMNTGRFNLSGTGIQTAALAIAGYSTLAVANTEIWNGTSWTEVMRNRIAVVLRHIQ